MHDHRLLAIVTILLAASLAGCVSEGDTAPETDEDDGPKAIVTDETGSLKGQLITVALKEVADAQVAAYDDAGDMVASTNSDKNGDYVLNDLRPDTYSVRIKTVCCHDAGKTATVAAGKVTELNFQLEILTAEDLNEPYMLDHEWNGFIACGARGGVPGVLAPGVALCSAADDPNDDFIHYFKMKEGVTSVVIGMDWNPTGGFSGQKLSLTFEQGICEEVACADAYVYAHEDGDPPFILRVDLADITEESASWANIKGEEEFKFRVFSGTDYANVVYQQPFSVYWYEFYNGMPVPDGFNPIPDA